MENLVIARPSFGASFWRGKRVLITGHTGFKGAWLSFWLSELGCEVSGIAIDPPSEPNLYNALDLSATIKQDFRCDIRRGLELQPLVEQIEPEVVFHLAAQSLVLKGYRSPIETFETNFLGTANLLETLRFTRPKAVIVATTDKVYAPTEFRTSFKESDKLGGADPYSASKAACELLVDSYRTALFGDLGIRVATARAGNVIGGGDWASDRLIPDAIRAWSSVRTLTIRRPSAVRPWQHVLDCLHGYLLLAQRLHDADEVGSAYNFGPSAGDDVSVSTIVEVAASSWGDNARFVSDPSPSAIPENEYLSLDSAKARDELQWIPRWNTEAAVRAAVRWYRGYLSGADPKSLCLRDLEDFGPDHP